MKKLLSLVLICVMGFGMISCVESEESQSVTELRNAKAEQLKALVNLYNAQAEAARITAQAEAALKAAEAAYKEALAQKTAQEIENEKAKLAAEIEKIKAEAEKALWEAKKIAAEYEQYIFENASKRIQALYLDYATAMNNLATAKNELLVAQGNLVALEAGVTDAQDNAEYYIGLFKKRIAGSEAQIAVLKDPKYTSVNVDSLYAIQQALYKEWSLAQNYYNTSEEVKAAAEAKDAAIAAIDEMDESIAEMNTIQKWTGSEWKYVINVNSDTKNPNKWFDSDDNTYNAVHSFDINETVLDIWKNEVVNSNLEDAVATATEDLEKAEAALEAFQGFKADFEKATEARAALYAYDQAYEKYDDQWETVEYAEIDLNYFVEGKWVENSEKEVKMATAQLVDTLNKVDLTKFTTEDYDEWDFNFWTRSTDMINSMDAFRAALATQEAKLEVLETAKEALEAAQEAKEALTEEATEAEVTAADALIEDKQDDVDNAEKDVKAAQEAVKKAYDKVVYDAEVVLVNAKKSLENNKKALADKQDALAKAKENQAALKEAFAAAKAATVTLNEIFEYESDFYKFWQENHIYYFNKGQVMLTQWNRLNFLVDANNDNEPDQSFNDAGEVQNAGLYVTNPYAVSYSDLAPYDLSTGSKKYFVEDKTYVGAEYDGLEAKYVSEVAKAKDALTKANRDLEQANEWKTNWDAKEKELRDFVASLNENLPEVQALVDAYYEADEARQAAYDEIDILWNKYLAAQTLASNGVDIDAQIRSLEDDIAYYKLQIAKYEKSITDAKAQLEYGKAHIANLEAQIEYLQKIVDSAKAALDAALSAEDAE
ncbi:MAG: hypothetical protein IJ476_05550 [Bacteroidales bacterium]|nr:hypothetical protein [Bacteroidales bacterium]